MYDEQLMMKGKINRKRVGQCHNNLTKTQIVVKSV